MPFSTPGNLPYPGIEPASPELTGGFFTTEPRGKPCVERDLDLSEAKRLDLHRVSLCTKQQQQQWEILQGCFSIYEAQISVPFVLMALPRLSKRGCREKVSSAGVN